MEKPQVIREDTDEAISDLFRGLENEGNKTQLILINHFLIFKPNLFCLAFYLKCFTFPLKSSKPQNIRLPLEKQNG